jgi:hypothetical protein
VRGDGLGVEAGGAQNARALAGFHLGAEQQVDARHGQVSCPCASTPTRTSTITGLA